MKQPTGELHDLARRLLEQEAAGNGPGGSVIAARRALDRLRAHLVTLVGAAGFQALLTRALALARRDVEWLEGVGVEADGSLSGFVDVIPERDADELARGGVILLAHLLGLLVTFIGEDLTRRLVRDAWSASSNGPSAGQQDMTQ